MFRQNHSLWALNQLLGVFHNKNANVATVVEGDMNPLPPAILALSSTERTTAFNGTDWQRVLQFARLFGRPWQDYANLQPDLSNVSEEILQLCANLIVEEVINELIPALGFYLQFDTGTEKFVAIRDPSRTPNAVEVADGGADSVYVILFLMIMCGIPYPAVFEEVHLSNMTKLDENGNAILRESDGKIMKGPDFVKANIAAVLTRFTGRQF